jgi:tetratricopeptide (TPR) repeat protein
MQDVAGNAITATPIGAEAYDRALLSLISFRQSVADDAERACEADPNAPMAVVLSAYLGLLSSERADALAAGERLRTIGERGLSVNDREALHLTAADRLLAGDLYGASQTTMELNTLFPRDALGLFVGHQIDFFTGASTQLETRLSAALPGWSETDEYRGYLEGMWSFGLEETGRYDEAMEVGLRAVERHPNDSWGIHAVTHVNEMRGDYERGLDFLGSRIVDWESGTFLNVHIAWHNALFLMEREDWAGALALYDRLIRNQESGDIAMEMLDAAALLWRLHLEDVDVGARWHSLADGWAAKRDEPWYVFNDMHAVMAFVGAGRRDDALTVVDDLETYLQTTSSSSNWEMTKRVGLPVCRALVQHAEGDWAAAAATLDPVIGQLALFGGSHAQRDVMLRTHIDALMRSGRTGDARTILESRLEERPSSVWAKTRLARV